MPSIDALAIKDYWHFLGGAAVREFAAAFAEKMGATYAIPVNSATSGLSTALAAARVSAGDEVIVPAISYTATATAVLAFNSIPVFVDVDPKTFCMSPEAIEASVTPRTKAILVVHLTGNVADMDKINDIAKRKNLVVIEDAAQAPGATWRGKSVGTIGDAGVYSLQQSKNIMTGEGGVIVTNNPEIARRARLISNHGEGVMDEAASPDDLADIIGFNFRMPELSAAVGLAQLERLDFVNEWRTRNAAVLQAGLTDISGIEVLPTQRQSSNGVAVDVPHLFVALYDREAAGISRDLFVSALRSEGVPVGTGYARCMYENPMFLKKIAYGPNGSPWTDQESGTGPRYESGMCPVAESLLYEKFLWFYHIAYSSTEEDMQDIIRAVHKVMANIEFLRAAEPDLQEKLGDFSQGRIGIDPKQLKTG
jgi:dTDP-4-amino-4,6-dideoxygalactose transaminase